MIHKEDLRIGNYIDYDGHLVEVIGLTGVTVRHQKANVIRTTSYHEVNGTRITEEFLEKTGWTKEKLMFEDDIIWSKIFQHQKYKFQIGDYPRENGNCGLLMAHYPHHEDISIDEQGNEVPVIFEATTVTIAHGIYDIHGLQNLWHGITKEYLKYGDS